MILCLKLSLCLITFCSQVEEPDQELFKFEES